MLQGIEARPLSENFNRFVMDVSAEGFEERMAGGDPFKVMGFSSFAVGRAAWILRRETGKLLVRLAFVTLKRRRCPGRLEGMGHTLYDP